MHLMQVVALTVFLANLLPVTSPGLKAGGFNSPRELSPPQDACGLFTLEEAGKAVGRTFRRARPGKEAEGTTCSLIGGTEGNITVTLSPSPTSQNFDDLRKLLTEQGEKPESVTGLGDGAYFWGARIYVRARNQLLVISNFDSNLPEAKARAQVLALAKLALTKLK
jgi:hypothetical protein